MNCSDKQYNLLRNFISEDNITKLKNNNKISSFIELILKTKHNHFLKKGCIWDELDFKIKYKDKTIEEGIIPKFKYSYGFKIPNYKVYDVFVRTYHVGHNNTEFKEYRAFERENYNKEYEGDYNILINMNIFTLIDFMIYLKNNKFN